MRFRSVGAVTLGLVMVTMISAGCKERSTMTMRAEQAAARAEDAATRAEATASRAEAAADRAAAAAERVERMLEKSMRK